MEPVLHEFHYGIEKIGEEPRNEKRQQNTAEVVDDKENGGDA